MSKKTLLTGVTGVLGSALLKEFASHEVICLTYRKKMSESEGVQCVSGDIRLPDLGLGAVEYARLSTRINGIVHAAAITQFNASLPEIEATNVAGTVNVLALARAARAPLYHVSTAFIHPFIPGSASDCAGVPARSAYERSKRNAESLLREQRHPVAIIRPSLIVGDSETGRLAQTQGFHLVLKLLLRNQLPIVPAAAESIIDFIPQDVVARAVVALVRNRIDHGEWWVTSGACARGLGVLVSESLRIAAELRGITIPTPRFVPLDMFERLIRPVFLPALPARLRTAYEQVNDLLNYLGIAEPLPCSLQEIQRLTGVPLEFCPDDVLQANVIAAMRGTRLSVCVDASAPFSPLATSAPLNVCRPETADVSGG